MQAPVQISFHGIDKSDTIESHIRTKVNKLERYFDRITACRVVVERHHRSRSNLATKDQPFHVSVVVEVPGEELVVKRDPKDPVALKAHRDLKIAVRDAFETMQRQLKEYVAKRWHDARQVPRPDQA